MLVSKAIACPELGVPPLSATYRSVLAISISFAKKSFLEFSMDEKSIKAHSPFYPNQLSMYSDHSTRQHQQTNTSPCIYFCWHLTVFYRLQSQMADNTFAPKQRHLLP